MKTIWPDGPSRLVSNRTDERDLAHVIVAARLNRFANFDLPHLSFFAGLSEPHERDLVSSKTD